MSRVGGGLGRGGDAGARGVCRGEGGTIAAQEPALNELLCLSPFLQVHLEVGGPPGPTGTDRDPKEGQGG